MIDGKTAEQWRAGFFKNAAMTYAEALLWIATRDAHVMADVFADARDPADDRATMIEAVASLHFPDEWHRHKPVQALTAALESGEVVAVGRPLLPVETRSGLPIVFVEPVAAQPIPHLEWLTLKIGDAYPCTIETVAAVPKRGLHGQTTLRGWGDLYFLTPGILRTFPGAGNVVPAPPYAASDARPNWYPRPAETMTPWLCRAEVLAEVQRRLDQKVTRKTSYSGVLWEMAKESGAIWTAGAIRNAYSDAERPMA